MIVTAAAIAAYLATGTVGLLWAMRTRSKPEWKVAALFIALWPAVAFMAYRDWVRS